jgi:hypothetical protein
MVNSGRVKFARFNEIGTMTQHLVNIKRLERKVDGEIADVSWVKAGADHYAHSLNYLYMASCMITAGEYTSFSPLPSIKEAFVGKNHESQV